MIDFLNDISKEIITFSHTSEETHVVSENFKKINIPLLIFYYVNSCIVSYDL